VAARRIDHPSQFQKERVCSFNERLAKQNREAQVKKVLPVDSREMPISAAHLNVIGAGRARLASQVNSASGRLKRGGCVTTAVFRTFLLNLAILEDTLVKHFCITALSSAVSHFVVVIHLSRLKFQLRSSALTGWGI
jgi:hypothetical protein